MLAPRTFIDPTPKPREKKKRKWLRQMTPARARQQMRIYSIRSKAFVRAHPICQIWLSENGWVEMPDQRYHAKGEPLHTFTAHELVVEFFAPRSIETHHTNRRHGIRLLDERFWMAVCRTNHDRVKQNQSEARAKGWLV